MFQYFNAVEGWGEGAEELVESVAMEQRHETTVRRVAAKKFKQFDGLVNSTARVGYGSEDKRHDRVLPLHSRPLTQIS